MVHEVVDGSIDCFAPLQTLEVGDQELRVDGRRMVEVVRCQVLRALPFDLTVVTVLGDECEALPADGIEDRLGDGGLAGAGAAGDAENDGRDVGHAAILTAGSLFGYSADRTTKARTQGRVREARPTLQRRGWAKNLGPKDRGSWGGAN